MKNIRIALWAALLVPAGAWLLADTLWPEPFNYFRFRGVAVQFTGVIAIAVMSVAMVLATRPHWLERHLGGLDKMYRLHKWLGISALVAALTHWWLAQGTKWMVAWGWLERRGRGPRTEISDPLQSWLNSQRHLAESLGEWAFYGAALLIVVALVKRIPYHWFAKTHKLLAVAYLVLVFHTWVLLNTGYWAQPVGWLVALLTLAGAAAALWVLAGRVGASRTTRGEVLTTRYFEPLRVTRTTVALPQGWPGHAPGQFAFVTSRPEEGAHPYTIASAWDNTRREITFVTKALGDHTATLHQTLRPGLPVKVQGPYGCFTFDDGAPRQVWIGGGIGITPFLGRMEQLASEREAGTGPLRPQVDLFHTTRDEDPAALALLEADARAAGVQLHVLVDARDSLLSAERIRTAVPRWREASFWFCGPTGFGEALRRDLVAHGLPTGRFHQELFEMR
ncbi:ferric reductase-like transmembrane domain-containing protein [Ottowia sp.]|uniref:ferredoxin reductase family protein n=1 Tax=Ottowia sp. TaxID=1898956 RepID=UPI00260DFA13|nr:ferric reductase-like transmembrane domain-containing protein [Ottowia sp.]